MQVLTHPPAGELWRNRHLAEVSPASERAQHLRLENVSHDIDGRGVLRNVSLDLCDHRIGIIGRNGSGKSMLARCLNGLIVPKSGRVTLGRSNTASDGAAIRRRVGMVFQGVEQQLIMPTVREDVLFGLRSLSLSREAAQQAAQDILCRFGIASLADRPIAELSGGEKRLVGLVGVLVMQPDHIVLDEPMTGLDHFQRRRLCETLSDLPQQVIVVSHELDYLREFDRIIAIHDGAVVMDGDPASTLQRWKDRYG